MLFLDFDTVAKTISVTGTVLTGPAAGVTGTLMEGTLESYVIDFSFPYLKLNDATGPDTKNPDLLEAFGIDADHPFSYFGFSFASWNVKGECYQGYSTDISNEGKIPEPISLILLGSGLAGAGLVRRFRKK